MEAQEITWLIQFIEEPTGIIVYVDSKIDPADIAEYGAENTTGILKTAGYRTLEIEQLHIPELERMAEEANAISDSRQRFVAWKKVENRAIEYARRGLR